MAAQRLDQLLVYDLDHLLGGGKGREHFLSHRLLPNVFNELLDDTEVDVGLEQGHANLAQSLVHVGGAQLPFAAQRLEDALKLIG